MSALVWDKEDQEVGIEEDNQLSSFYEIKIKHEIGIDYD